jgi:hypothetical protein
MQVVEEFFSYTVLFENVGGNTSAQNNILIEADSAFRVNKLSAQSVNGGNILASVLIRDSGSGRQLSNQPVYVRALFGTAENPFILPVPRVFAPRSTIQFVLTNLDGTPLTVQLALHGAKVYRS